MPKNRIPMALPKARAGNQAGADAGCGVPQVSQLGGIRNEYLQLCLEDEHSLDLLTDVAEFLANGMVPPAVATALALSQMTALRKPNGRVRGICAGETFRRLVEKTLARQFSQVFRDTVAPANFGFADRCGCDGLIHMVRAQLEFDDRRTLLSIDGVGAYDHVSRARMLTELWRVPELRELVPFVRLWLDRRSTFVWTDDEGTPFDIPQGEGGEQGAALTPALFCLAMRPALEEIQGLRGGVPRRRPRDSTS